MGRRHARGEGAVYQRASDGKWVCALRIPQPAGGTRRKVWYFATRKAAEAHRVATLAALAKAEPVITERVTVAAYLTRWLAYKATRVRPSTLVWYEMHCRTHLAPLLGTQALAALTPLTVQAVLDHWAATGLSPTTIGHIRNTIRAALAQAVRWGLVARNVATLTDPPRRAPSPARALSPEQARAFLAAASGHKWEALFVVAVACGLRQGELLGLRWQDVDLTARTLTVAQAMQRVNGKLTAAPPKTAQSRRTIPLPAPVVLALRGAAMLQAAQRQAAGAAWQEQGLCFTTGRGTPISAGKLTDAFHAVRDAAGVPPIRFHDLRHTCATLLLTRNVHPRVVQEILGHSDPRVTLAIYSHVAPVLQEAAAATMAGLLATPPATAPGHESGADAG